MEDPAMMKRKAVTKILTNKSCKQMTDLLYDYLNDKLSQTVKRDFDQHLSICPDCVSFLNTYKKTVAVTRYVDAQALPPRVRDNVLTYLRKRMQRVGAFLLFIATQLLA